MKTTILFASAIFVAVTGAAMAQPGRDGIPMRDGSTIINVGGGCLVQYGRRNERINNAQRCSDNDLREADSRMAAVADPALVAASAVARACRLVPGRRAAVAA